MATLEVDTSCEARPRPARRSLELLGARSVLVAAGERPAAPFTLLESKLSPPSPLPGAVSRTALVNRLRALASATIVSIVAPAGYGKTTACAQWARRDGRACAWLTADDRDNDPVVLLRHLATTVERAVGLDPGVFDALRFPGDSVWTAALPRLAAAIAAVENPLLLIVDDVHLLRSGDAASALETLAEHLPQHSTLALAGRHAARLPLARLRAAGTLAEVGVDDLCLSPRETALLVRAMGVRLDLEELTELRRRAEGWPAGVALLAQAAAARHGVERGLPTGSERVVAEYFRSEVTASLTQAELSFARRTAVLDCMCGPLCDAVLDGRASAARRLEALEDAGAFVVPLDTEGRWYRYHGLFRQFLLHELEEDELDLVAELHRRAADWYESRGLHEAAVSAAEAAGDDDRVASLVGAAAIPATCAGKLDTVAGWFDRLEDHALERHAPVAALAAWVSAVRGRGAEAERLLAVAERGRRRDVLPDGTRLDSLVGLLRATFCGDGPEQMVVDADAALASLSEGSRLLSSGLLLRATALMLAGDAAADAVFADAADAAERIGAPDVRALALSERSLLAAGRDDHAAAEALAREALAEVEASGTQRYALSAITFAASARALLRHGRWDQARSQLTAALELVPRLTEVLPWAAVQTRLELAHAFLALRDDTSAKTLLAEARAILERRPNLGTLVPHVAALARELETLHHEAKDAGQGLTAAELRLLPMLSTHMSFREIGDRLFVSRNTIKTQAISVYRKLGVSTRSAAVERAEHLGLIEPFAVVGEFHPDRTT